MGIRSQLRRLRPTWSQILISLMIAGLGLMGAEALSQVDQDLRLMYTEYTLAATDLAHISADVIRYRTTVIRSLEAPTKKDFDHITASLPDQRARIQHAVDRYASASLRVSRSGRSEPQDIKAVQESLNDYFAAANRTILLMSQLWVAKSAEEAAELRTKAELHAADNAGPKLIQVSLALDRLLETVAEVAKDMRDEGTKTIRRTSEMLIGGSLLIAFMNLFVRRRPASSDTSETSETASTPSLQPEQQEAPPFSLPLESPDPLVRRE
ncbi:MAG: MCP four helix bundle domain-containing protein [Nitrospirae bacterium]|nr:MCP four helix bundle domain-containing protein [Nitrospirota bacterium]